MTRTVEELRKIAEEANDALPARDLRTVNLLHDFREAATPAVVRELLSSYSQMREALEAVDRLALRGASLGYNNTLGKIREITKPALSLNPTTGEMK
jgi:hypothetical protein